MLNNIISFIKSNFPELLIVLALFIYTTQVIQLRDLNIRGDGTGYYDYLPSIFVYEDFHRSGRTKAEHPELYERINAFNFYLPFNEHRINKYPIGTAVLQAPFFLTVHFLMPDDNDEIHPYEHKYMLALFNAALFYLFFGLVYFRKTLVTYGIRRWLIIVLQLAVVFGTSLSHYTYFDFAYSHVYSFAFISILVFHLRSMSLDYRSKNLLYACAALGMVILLRHINVFVLLFIPFLAGDFARLQTMVTKVFSDYKNLILGVLMILLIFSIQVMSTVMQSGDYVFQTYIGEKFMWDRIMIPETIFGYRKGLFTWTPILLLAVVAIVVDLFKGYVFRSISWLLTFAFVFYVFSAWWAWDFGYCYSLRAYVDYLTLFFIPIAYFLNKQMIPVLIGAVVFMALTTYLNLVQSYQYKLGILNWVNMEKETYWRVFLKTHERYRWNIWKPTAQYEDYHQFEAIELGDLNIPSNQMTNILDTNLNQSASGRLDLIQPEFYNAFDEHENAKLIIRVTNLSTGEEHLIWDYFLLRCLEEDYNQMQLGKVPIKIDASVYSASDDIQLKVDVLTHDEELVLNDFNLRLYTKK